MTAAALGDLSEQVSANGCETAVALTLSRPTRDQLAEFKEHIRATIYRLTSYDGAVPGPLRFIRHAREAGVLHGAQLVVYAALAVNPDDAGLVGFARYLQAMELRAQKRARVEQARLLAAAGS